MFLCLSSAARPAYRKDILRALAMPSGMHLNFRYDEKWIEKDIVPKALGQSCLIAYIDQTGKDTEPIIVPCRFATIVKAEVQGKFVMVTLCMGNFACVSNATDFTDSLRKSSQAKIPAWKDEKITGLYWLDVGDLPGIIENTTDLKTWQGTVDQISKRVEFRTESLYYCVEQMCPVGHAASPATLLDGVFSLKVDKEYEMSLSHYHPTDSSNNSSLEITSTGEILTLTSYNILSFDSRYDKKTIRFRTKKSSSGETGTIVILRTDGEKPEIEFEMPIGVQL